MYANSSDAALSWCWASHEMLYGKGERIRRLAGPYKLVLCIWGEHKGNIKIVKSLQHLRYIYIHIHMLLTNVYVAYTNVYLMRENNLLCLQISNLHILDLSNMSSLMIDMVFQPSGKLKYRNISYEPSRMPMTINTNNTWILKRYLWWHNSYLDADTSCHKASNYIHFKQA